MPIDQNPYAPPQAVVDGGGASSEYWREGTKALHIERGADLPHRCVKCNAPAVTPVKARKLYWHHGGIYFLILVNWLIYLVVALIVRKQFELSPGLCAEHTGKRNRNILIAWSLFGFAVLTTVYAAKAGSGEAGLFAVACFLASVIMGFIAARIVYPTEIQPGFAVVKGFGEPFLKSIPPRVARSRFANSGFGARIEPTIGPET